LCNDPWRGHVGQLRTCMERLVVTVEGPTIHAEDLPAELAATPRQNVVTLEEAVQEVERAAIQAALQSCNQHRERAAGTLGISVRTLHYKMNRYRLQELLGLLLQVVAEACKELQVEGPRRRRRRSLARPQVRVPVEHRVVSSPSPFVGARFASGVWGTQRARSDEYRAGTALFDEAVGHLPSGSD